MTNDSIAAETKGAQLSVLPKVAGPRKGGLIASIFAAALVKSYKFAGFIILSVILVGMGAYLSASAFYLVSRDWVVPAVLTPGNDKVIVAHLSYLDKINEFDKIQSEEVSLTEGLRVAEMSIAAWSEFTNTFSSALDLEEKQSTKKLTAVEGLVKAIETGKSTEKHFSALSIAQIDKKLKAGMIDLAEHGRLKAVLMKSNLETAENDGRMVGLQQQAVNLRKLVQTGKNADVDLLLRQKPLIEAQLGLAKEEANKIILTSRLAQLTPVLESYRKVIDTMRENPYVKASTQEIPVAFVSYDNLRGVNHGTAVFSCVLEFIFCQQVGKVSAILEGEVASRHPVSGKDMRGKMIEIDLKSIAFAQKKTLILKRPPFFF
jgi:hypothetical protein